jgi:hypothetical protein
VLPGVVPAYIHVIVRLAGGVCGGVVEEKRRAPRAANWSMETRGKEGWGGREDQDVRNTCACETSGLRRASTCEGEARSTKMRTIVHIAQPVHIQHCCRDERRLLRPSAKPRGHGGGGGRARACPVAWRAPRHFFFGGGGGPPPRHVPGVLLMRVVTTAVDHILASNGSPRSTWSRERSSRG